MNRETSVYLDLVRFSAAMIVMIGHLSGSRFTGGLFWRFGQFMDDAVMVFFVLSGFVIAHVVHHKESGVANYAIARAARIYSVAFPALILTFILDAVGRQIAPEMYSPSWGYHADNLIGQFLAGAFFVNQLWYTSIGTGSMLPYWSLGFEVWYYVFFALIFFARKQWKVILFLLACAIAGPRIVAFFPIWMVGYFTYVYSARHAPGRRIGMLLLTASVIGYALYYFVCKHWLLSHQVLSDSLGLENLVSRYIVGALFAFHLAGFVWASTAFSALLNPCRVQIRWLAGATFTIYLFHIPVAQFLSTIVPWSPADWRTRFAMFGGTLALMFVIAHFTERKKELWSQWFRVAYVRLRARLLPA